MYWMVLIIGMSGQLYPCQNMSGQGQTMQGFDRQWIVNSPPEQSRVYVTGRLSSGRWVYVPIINGYMPIITEFENRDLRMDYKDRIVYDVSYLVEGRYGRYIEFSENKSSSISRIAPPPKSIPQRNPSNSVLEPEPKPKQDPIPLFLKNPSEIHAEVIFDDSM